MRTHKLATFTLAFLAVGAMTTQAFANDRGVRAPKDDGLEFRIMDCYCGKTANEHGTDTLHMDIVIVRKFNWNPATDGCSNAEILLDKRVNVGDMNDHGGQGHQGIPSPLTFRVPPAPDGCSTADEAYVIVSSTAEPNFLGQWIFNMVDTFFPSLLDAVVPGLGDFLHAGIAYLDNRWFAGGLTGWAGSISCGLYHHADGGLNWFYEKALNGDGSRTQESLDSHLVMITTPVPPHTEPAVCFHLRSDDPNSRPQYILEAGFFQGDTGYIAH